MILVSGILGIAVIVLLGMSLFGKKESPSKKYVLFGLILFTVLLVLLIAITLFIELFE